VDDDARLEGGDASREDVLSAFIGGGAGRVRVCTHDFVKDPKL